MSEFLAMGGYAAFVWPSYGVAALIMVGLLAATLKSLRSGEATLRALEGSRPARRRRDRAPASASASAVNAPAVSEVREG
ncbi:heme exporter protein CcmD [Azospirillum sp. SYSU D00513]|uniref:heme exporter protein CcmD n=1 Tax=Azospirillum sp. SYSU D00513 TaxID=2812561 RepID=UPI001A96734C|nr:heme exporter protein CcmD [Azospirillum sp. SYSU D00513]